MSNRRRKRGARAMALVAAGLVDLGPKVQHENGRLVVDRAATDPDRPNHAAICRARANPHYTRLASKGAITLPQWMACDAYSYTTEQRDGARWVNGEHVGGSSTNPAFRGHPTMTQVQASARLTSAHAALGNDASALLQLFVVQNLSFTDLAKRRKEGDEVVKGMVIAAIRHLAEHWGMEEKVRNNA